MLVMTLVIALKHPVLGYCLCLDSYFTGHCICEEHKQDQSAIITPDSCMECCASEQEAVNEQSTPCDDCTKQLNIDIDDFVWNVPDIAPDVELWWTDDAPVFARDNPFLVSQIDSRAHGPIRGDPPPGEHPALFATQGIPVYIRHSAMRL